MPLLTEEQRLIQNTARQFAAEVLAPGAAAWDAASTFPADAVRQMGELGFMGMLAPEAYAGIGADHVAYALAVEAIAEGDGACSTIMSVQNLVCSGVSRFGSEEQKRRFLEPMARGEMLGAFCLTEPQAGSDASNQRTRALRDGNGYVLNGAKQFITSGKHAGVALVFAVTDPGAGSRGISAFLLATDNPGYRVESVEKKLGQHASDTALIRFDDLRVTGDALVGAEGEGYRIALSNLEGGRIGIAAQSVGMAAAAFTHARAYAAERESFGKPINQHQAVAFRLADMATRIEAARQLVLNAARLRDAGEPCLKEACMAKLYASEMAEQVCSDAIQIHGGYGYLSDFPVERIYRDVRVCQIYEGTSDVQRMVIARELGEAMTEPIDFYFDFSSPYGYFAAMRIDDLAARHGRQVRWCPYLMGVAMKLTGGQPLVARDLVREYARRDMQRSARLYGIPFTLPEPFPIATQVAARAFWWLSSEYPVRARELAKALYRAYFVDGRNIGEPEVVLDVAADAGVDRSALADALNDNAVKARVRQVTDEAIERGIFGSPYIIADDEPFWGNDRLDQVDEWLTRGGW